MISLQSAPDPSVRNQLGAYDDLLAGLLARRGILTSEAAERFLNPSYDDHVHDPLLMRDLPKAAERLARAILSGEHIAVWSDYDADGIPGATLLHDFLKKTGAQFETYIPHRHREGYGVNRAGVEMLVKERGVTLIVTVDSGITDVEAVARAGELGADVIVTDHHLPGEMLPPAYAVVNPNARPDESYPFRALCGAAVAWKLVCGTLSVEPRLRARAPVGWEKWLLDVVGLATIADMVPLIGENRVLASYGLRVLRKSPRLGLQKLCRGARVNQRTLTEDDVAFMLAPRVNAAGRMGDAREAFSLLTTGDEDEADMLAKKIEQANRQRKAESGALTRAIRAQLAQKSTIPAVIVCGDPMWRPALLGLAAGGIAEEYGRPVFLWGREGDLRFKGSVRGGGVVHVLELMRAAEDAFVEFGGHAAAGGFTARPEAIFSLEERLNDAFARLARGAQETETPRADAELTSSAVTAQFLERLERLAPFGIENPRPSFLLRESTVRGVSFFGKHGEHLKLLVARDDAEPLEAISFFVREALRRDAEKLATGGRAHLLVHVERDFFSRRGAGLRLRLLAIHLV